MIGYLKKIGIFQNILSVNVNEIQNHYLNQWPKKISSKSFRKHLANIALNVLKTYISTNRQYLLYSSCSKNRKKEVLHNTFYETCVTSTIKLDKIRTRKCNCRANSFVNTDVESMHTVTKLKPALFLYKINHI